ncbi:MAG: Rieske 2Fe-2S domain-containing protein [Deltaproteobacteria bacterium]|nr:Rieske 2Fe-2S domain-containing protein [Deltaproteobacteria bacterium]
MTANSHLWGRRRLLTAVAWSAVSSALLAGSAAFVRLLVRRAPIDPPTIFRAGPPAKYPPGTVSDHFVRKWRVFIVNDAGRLIAVFARCTHLGCTPRWYASDVKFKCPCHGSGFTLAGVNFEGPAPRPLERAKIWLARDGEIRIDVGQRFNATEFDQPGASLSVSAAPEVTS